MTTIRQDLAKTLSRRTVLVAGALAGSTLVVPSGPVSAARRESEGVERRRTGSVRTKDGADIFYKDWGRGPAVVFSHGWPLTADVWDDQMLFLASHGYRCIAYDRRGHGRSTQTWDGNDYDTFADDLSSLLRSLGIRSVTLVGHSAGGGDVARYVGRYGSANVGKTVLVSAIPPVMVKGPGNPEGVPPEVFDGIRTALTADRAQFYRELGEGPFFGGNRPDSKVSRGVKDSFWLWCMQAGLRASFEGVRAFSETDFTADLRKFDMPTLIIHGEDDQNVPVRTTALVSSKIIRKATLKIYAKAPHGLTVTHRDRFNDDLLDFLKS